MKKILIILSAMVLAAASCTKFAEDSPRIFAASGDVKAPVITLGLAPGANADSSFTVRVTPAEGTSYYAWAIFEGAAANLPAANLLANAYKADAMSSGSVKLEAGKENFFVALEDLEPNTTYTVYAVACDADGITSEVAVKSHLTTDSSEGPILIDADSEIDDDGVMWLYAKFSKPVELGEGAVTLQQYALNSAPDATTGFLVPERTMVAPEDNVMVEGAWLCVAVPEALAVPGALITMTWEAGTVVNSAGLKDAGYAVSEVSADGLEDGIGERYETIAFKSKLPMILDESGKLVRMPSDTVITVYDYTTLVMSCVTDSVVVKGTPVVSVSCRNLAGRKLEFMVAAPAMAADDSTVVAGLDEKPGDGYWITYTLAKDCLEDIWGNTNAEFTSTENYFLPNAYTAADFAGTYTFTGVAQYAEDQTDTDVIIAPDPDNESGLIIYNLFNATTCMDDIGASYGIEGAVYAPVASKAGAVFDKYTGKMVVEAFMTGVVNVDGTPTYPVYAIDKTAADLSIGMTFNAGAITFAVPVQMYVYGYTIWDTVNDGVLTRTSTDYTVPASGASAYLWNGVDKATLREARKAR